MLVSYPYCKINQSIIILKNQHFKMKICPIWFSTMFLCVESIYCELLELHESTMSNVSRNITDFLDSSNFLSICENHFNSSRILSIITEDSKMGNWTFFINKMIQTLHQQNGIPVIVMNMNIEPLKFEVGGIPAIEPLASQAIRDYPAESEHSYLLVVHDVDNLTRYIHQTDNEQQTLWNPKDNFTIIIAPILNQDCSSSNITVLDTMWQKRWILNAIVILKYFIECHSYSDAIFTYNPFQKNDMNDYGIIVNTNAQLDYIPKTYLERTWNLGGYPLKVSLYHVFPTAQKRCWPNSCTPNCWYEYMNQEFYMSSESSEQNQSYMFSQRICNNCSCTYEGRDWEVLQNLAIYMNFTVSIQNDSDGDIDDQISNLKLKVSDLAFNERFMKSYDEPDIEFTMPAFYTRKIVILVSKAQKIPIWSVIFEYFSGYFWLYFTLTFVSSCVFWYILRRTHENVSQLTNALDMLALFLTMSVNFITKIAISSQRILLSCCLFFSLIVMCCFQSSLLDVVSHPHFKPDINTLKQLDEAEIPIFTLDPSLRDTFENSESIYMKNLNTRVRYDRNLAEDRILQEIVINKNCSLLTSMTEAHWYLGKYPNGLHIVKEYPREYFVSYIIPRGSPYATRIHNLLGKMSQAGLVTKWDEDSNYILKLEAIRDRKTYQTTSSGSVFAFYNLIFSFLVYGTGIIAGVLVFIVELSKWIDLSVRFRNPNDSKIGKAYIVL
ncbi:Ionotropic receptor 879 [Blattella germanica]|nr:Ionotropic receptor 879 [Blattella germanica]